MIENHTKKKKIVEAASLYGVSTIHKLGRDVGTLEALVGGPNRLGLRLLHSVRGIVRISLRHRAHIKTRSFELSGTSYSHGGGARYGSDPECPTYGTH
jgi:hypothetical protein